MQNLPTQLFSAQVCRELEQTAMRHLGISSYELMQRAGLAAYQQLQQLSPKMRRIVVICGSGNNGGDGYIIAALAARGNYHVTVIRVGTPRSDDAQRAYNSALAVGVDFTTMSNIDWQQVDIVVDALLGIGVTSNVYGEKADIIDLVNHSGCDVLSIDVPSGLIADTGAATGYVVQATHTCTFVGMKAGLLTANGPDVSGDISFHDLDIPASIYESSPAIGHIITPFMVSRLLPTRQASAHKGTHGHAVLVGGNHGMAGALRLASEAAARSGAGLISAITVSDHMGLIDAKQPEIMTHCSDDPHAAHINRTLNAATSIGVGPGLGVNLWAKSLWQCICKLPVAKVIDADALNLLSTEQVSFSSSVITPHPGEAARLLGCSIAEVNADRISTAFQLSRKYSTVCILKGCGTVVCDGKNIWVNTTGNPGMASGGMGDCLTGIITALMAQGLTPLNAALVGVWLHGAAADIESRENGTIGMLASDVIARIRYVVNQLSESDD